MNEIIYENPVSFNKNSLLFVRQILGQRNNLRNFIFKHII